MNLRLRFQLIILVCLLGAFSLVFAGPNDAKSAYDQVQKARDLAWEKFDSDSGSLGLEEGLRLLDEAEGFLDSAVVFDLANGSYFLRNRKFHLFMDRGLAYLKYGKRDEAVKQFSAMLREEFSPDIFDFLVGEVGVEELKDIEEIQSLNRLAKSMGRVWGKSSFSRDYSADISVGEKIAGLSTFWSNAKFSFAYFDQVPNLDWDEVYKSYVDRVINTRSTEEYYRVLMTLAPLLEDGHTNIYPPSELQKRFWSRPPVRTKLIQGKVVITDIYSEKVRASGVALGDIVLEINGVEVNKYVKENVAPYVSSSTSQDREVREYRYSLLSGPADEKVAVLVERDGKSYSLEFKRTPYGDEVYPLPFSFRKEKNDSIYIDVRTFSNYEAYRFLLEQYESLKDSKSLIIDLRSNDGGSTANAYKLLSLLVDKPFETSIEKVRDVNFLNLAQGRDSVGWINLPREEYKAIGSVNYSMPVYVLSGPQTISAAEDFLVAFKSSARGLILGQDSAGSSGQPYVFPLPAGGKGRICIKRDLAPDGKEFVGYGISPDIKVEPKISDFVKGRDAVLDKALSL